MQNKFNKEEVQKILSTFKNEKSEILKALHAVQNHHPQQYISEEAMQAVAKYFNLTLGQVFGIVTYYSMFSTKPRSPYIIRICKSPVCYMKGSFNLLLYLESKLEVNENKVSKDGLFTVETSECLGLCEHAPSMMVNSEVYTKLSEDKIDKIISEIKNKVL